jgi:hypothetical protein
MDLFLIGADPCGGLGPIMVVIYKVLTIFWILIPIALIVFGTIDLGKAVIASDEKEVKAAQGRLIKRFIYAALVFFVPMLVTAVMGLLTDSNTNSKTSTNTTSWDGCYQYIRGN